jgi:hypothetical protein
LVSGFKPIGFSADVPFSPSIRLEVVNAEGLRARAAVPSGPPLPATAARLILSALFVRSNPPPSPVCCCRSVSRFRSACRIKAPLYNTAFQA